MKSLMLLLAILATSGAPAEGSDAAGAATFAPRTSVAGQAPANEPEDRSFFWRDDRPFIWPTMRYGWPEKWSVGAALQSRRPGLNRLVVSGTVGTGGHKVGLGYGRFGGTIMGGTAVLVTLLRTSYHPRAPSRIRRSSVSSRRSCSPIGASKEGLRFESADAHHQTSDSGSTSAWDWDSDRSRALSLVLGSWFLVPGSCALPEPRGLSPEACPQCLRDPPRLSAGALAEVATFARRATASKEGPAYLARP
jgi:hypothetical protein